MTNEAVTECLRELLEVAAPIYTEALQTAISALEASGERVPYEPSEVELDAAEKAWADSIQRFGLGYRQRHRAALIAAHKVRGAQP